MKTSPAALKHAAATALAKPPPCVPLPPTLPPDTWRAWRRARLALHNNRRRKRVASNDPGSRMIRGSGMGYHHHPLDSGERSPPKGRRLGGGHMRRASACSVVGSRGGVWTFGCLVGTAAGLWLLGCFWSFARLLPAACRSRSCRLSWPPLPSARVRFPRARLPTAAESQLLASPGGRMLPLSNDHAPPPPLTSRSFPQDGSDMDEEDHEHGVRHEPRSEQRLALPLHCLTAPTKPLPPLLRARCTAAVPAAE